MERRLPLIRISKKAFVSLLLLCTVFCPGILFNDRLYAQETESSFGSRKIRFMLTVPTDSYPGLEMRSGKESPFHDGDVIDFSPEPKDVSEQEDFEEKRQYLLDFPVNRMKELAAFVLEGMIYGWNWEYVPSDKARKVADFFEFTQIHEFDEEINKIRYDQSEIIDSTALRCWVNTERTEAQYLSLREWNSVQIPRIHGNGSGSMEKDFDGIREAVQNAIKDAVREYFRKTIKNKPKELSGRVLVTGTPKIYIKEGRYFADLDFFIETDRIIKYTSY